MLQEFITDNRAELIDRCNRKSAKDDLPFARSERDGPGVPAFLDQLIDALRMEQVPAVSRAQVHRQERQTSDIGRAAAQRGAELLQRGYTIDEVVHEYGNVCQSVTELAIERMAQISNQEFRTLNRCLDDAIADAVTSYASAGNRVQGQQTRDVGNRLDALAEEHGKLLAAAHQAFSAIRAGNVGATGATGTLLLHALSELAHVVDRAITDLRREAAVASDAS
ncbi:MAG: hypothetical protein ABIR62_13390 [Dokdonella sp.]|uniref:hypothetical protein n=1 Tax=Dokdonella sp. TaxID=2291710 RepID=UPI0032659D7D